MSESISFDHRLALLRKFPDFSGSGANFSFTYDLFARENCQQTIERYHLDEQFKGREDLELILALLDWVGSHFCQDGACIPPWPLTVDSLTAFGEAHGNSSNCQGLSVLLSTLLRAYGVKAKPVYCLPEEQPFSDCHVVVHAYSRQLNQWILLDPSYTCVVLDETGRYLDLPGLRRAYLEGKRDSLATWKQFKHPDPAEDFSFWLDYMAKNTFRFCCTLSNSASFSADWQAQIELVPDGYHSHSVDAVTSDAGAFWALP